jgi:formylglycine-generating enzyme required for sulfatase activity
MKRKNPITKKAATFLFCAALSAGALLILSCTQLFEPPVLAFSVPAPSGETGRVVLAVASGAAKTIMPAAPVFSRYKLVFSKSGESDIVIDPALGLAGSAGESKELAAGTWTATVTGYQNLTVSGGSAADYPAARGSESVTVSAGQITNVIVHLTPLPVNGAEQGIFTYKVNFPAGVTSAELTLGGETPVTLTSGTEVSMAKASGYYDLFISLKKGALSAGLAEKVHIYAGLESKGEFAFTDADFTATVGLAGSVSLPGGLTWTDMSSGTVKVYSDPSRTAQIGTVALTGLTWKAGIQATHIGTTVYLGAELLGTNGKVYTGTGDTGGSVTETGVKNITLSDTTAPANVTGLSGEHGPGDGEVTITWTDPTDVDLDHIEITWDHGGTSPVSVTKGTGTKTITGLTAGTAYTFTVKALDTAGNKSGGATASASPFVKVTGITGLPAVWQKTIPLTLSGTVAPAEATNKTITWLLINGGTTGANIISGNTLTAPDKGTVKVRATIANGTAAGNYTQDFDITITPKAGDVMTRTITGGGASPFEIRFYYVPAGSFQRDATTGNISVITKGYWMAETEVTQELFYRVMEERPSGFTTNPEDDTNSDGWKKLPVEHVSWYDAIAFCNKLSLMDTGTDPSTTSMYALPQNNPTWSTLTYGNIPTGNDGDWNYAGMIPNIAGYRLPTQMEWLWAAMDADKENPGQPNTTGYLKAFAGDDAGHTRTANNYAWHLNNSSNKTHQVGEKLANDLGLFDMTGNVSELCWDLRPGTMPSGEIENYTGPTSNEDGVRTFSGFAYSFEMSGHPLWYYAYRTGNSPFDRLNNNTGIRLVFSE